MIDITHHLNPAVSQLSISVAAFCAVLHTSPTTLDLQSFATYITLTSAFNETHNPCSTKPTGYMPFDTRRANPTRPKRHTRTYCPRITHRRRTIFDQGHDPRTTHFTGKPLTATERLHVARQRLRKFEKTQSRKAQRKTWVRNGRINTPSKLDRIHLKLKRIFTGNF